MTGYGVAIQRGAAGQRLISLFSAYLMHWASLGDLPRMDDHQFINPSDFGHALTVPALGGLRAAEHTSLKSP
jgi:hypothetical protein